MCQGFSCLRFSLGSSNHDNDYVEILLHPVYYGNNVVNGIDNDDIITMRLEKKSSKTKIVFVSVFILLIRSCSAFGQRGQSVHHLLPFPKSLFQNNFCIRFPFENSSASNETLPEVSLFVELEFKKRDFSSRVEAGYV